MLRQGYVTHGLQRQLRTVVVSITTVKMANYPTAMTLLLWAIIVFSFLSKLQYAHVNWLHAVTLVAIGFLATQVVLVATKSQVGS